MRRLHRSCGQVFGQLVSGSQVSVGSWTLLPHMGWQSSSVLALQPAGQQRSPLVQDAWAWSGTHWAWQVSLFISL
jgi:hypothetical protein